MSELQIGLAFIGALVVAGVLVYNRIQERRARREADRSFRSEHADVLLEPGARGGDAAEPVAPSRSELRVEPQVDMRSEPSVPPAHAPAASPDPAIDYVMAFASSVPAADASVHEQWAAIERRHGGRARLAPDAAGHAWRAGLQLVSRDGAVGEAELIEFRSSVETLAASIGATVTEAPEMRAAVEAARVLDEFCAEADIQVVIHVQGGPFAGTKVRATAESSGLALEDSGRFVLRNDAGVALYTLGARDGAAFSAATMKDAAPAALTLALDVARVPDTRRSFESMARLAHHLAALLGGSIVDDNGNALDDRAVAAIAQQLDAVCARLEANGIAPGGAAALRLFS